MFQNMNGKKLNLGCGEDIKNPNEGWVNLDFIKLPGVDVVFDIEKPPFPFKDEEFDEILAQDTIEHILNHVPVMKDLHRILKPGGKLTIRVPHFTSVDSFSDPTHKKMFSILTFFYFVKNPPTSKGRERQYYFDFHFSKVKSIKITFEHGSRLFLYNRFVRGIVNRSLRFQEIYEQTFFSRLFPAKNILVELIK